ncbi:2Fe-2S iron-sulfur cluster binding domain-containing protein [Candidatus Peregrinibacteria bacterium]|jgi:ferredoxin|nr:2Fe-2S iron-sulfur cluster binding domain-containing protein [Candidatus Peregrinibacteria bacterium]
MAYVIIDGKKVPIQKGQNLMDIEDEISVPFACRSGVCQACAVTMKKGEENCSRLNENEEMMGAEGSHRLGCQVVCCKDGDEVEIELEAGWV